MGRTPKRSKTQIEKFRETARALGADKSERQFDTVLKRVAKSPVPPRKATTQKQN